MNDIVFKDCEYRYVEENGTLCCKNKDDYDRIVDLLNEQHEQIERLKGNFRALEEVKCELADENEQLKQHNIELINKIDFLERVIDGDVE